MKFIWKSFKMMMLGNDREAWSLENFRINVLKGVLIGGMLMVVPHISLAQVHAPTQMLDTLFKEREKVYSKAKDIYEQNNALFGGKAKRDLIEAIEELKRVVAIDNKIVLEVERLRFTNEFERFSAEGEMLESMQRVEELEQANLQLQDKLTEQKAQLLETQNQLASGKQSRVMQGFLIVLLFLSNGVFIYLFFRTKKRPEGEAELE
ncbi:MAG: hypothetical protein WD077_11060 [Bacteroidia bacterium]